MKKLLFAALLLIAVSCGKDEKPPQYNPNQTVASPEHAQDALDKKLTASGSNGAPITLELPALSGDAGIQIPAELNATNTPEINFKVESGFENLVISDKTGGTYDGTINVVTSSSNSGNLHVNMPSASVAIDGYFSTVGSTGTAPSGSRANVIDPAPAPTEGISVKTLIIKSTATVDQLNIACGDVELYGTLNLQNVSRNAGCKILKGLAPGTSFKTALSIPQIDGVILSAGQYQETDSVDVDRPFVIYGPNRGIDPNTKTRNPEAVVSVRFQVNTDAAKSGDIIVDGVKFTGDTYIILNKNIKFKHKESKILNCIIENTLSKSNGFFYVWMPAEKIEFSYNKVSNVAMNEQGKGDNMGVIIWRTDVVRAIGNTFNRDNATSGMTSNAGLDISANDQNSGDDVIDSLVVQNNYFGIGLCVKFQGDVYPVRDITGNTFAGGRGEKGCFVLFKRDFTELELANVTANNTFMDDSAVRKHW